MFNESTPSGWQAARKRYSAVVTGAKGFRRLPALGLLSLAIALTHAAPVHAQNVGETRNYAISSQPLSTALNQLALAADRQIMVPPELVRGRTAPALAGYYSFDVALKHLLTGSGLTYKKTDAATVIITREPPKSSRGPSKPSTAVEKPVIEMTKVTVVGTLLRNVSPTSPVITLDREDIERGGYVSVQDIMAKVPQNFAGQSAATGNLTGGNVGFTNQIDIRGLGSQSTLTLIDGRRISSAAGDEGRAVDINMIPVSAIERIDILTDGASALYGSDAVGGVVNIVLRKDFDGAESSLQYGSNKVGGNSSLFSQSFGHSWQGGRILGTLQYQKSDAVTSSRLGFDTQDYRSRGGGDFRIGGFGSPGTIYPAGFFQGLPFTSLTAVGGVPVYSAAIPAAQDGRGLRVDQLRLNEVNTTDFVSVDTLPAQNNASAYLDFEQELGAVTLFIDAAAARRRSHFLTNNYVSYLEVPSSNAFTPFNEDVLVGYELADFGPLPYSNASLGWFTNAGLRGALSGDWTWQAVGTVSSDRSKTSLTVPDEIELNMRLASSDPTYAFNPFGDGTGQSPGVIDALRQQVGYDGRTSQKGASVLFQGSVAELSGGALRLALGGEFHRESMRTTRTLGNGPVLDMFRDASRHVAALFGEAYFPLVGNDNARRGVRELALSLAGRYERYSDFGETANPKLGVLWRPTDALVLKANWGTSFRAPSLRQLTFESAISPNIPVLDTKAPGGPATVFVDILQGGNPDLKPEKARTWTLSADYRLPWLIGAQLSADYFRTDYRERIRGSLDGLTYTTLLQYEDSLPSGIVVRDATGHLTSINNSNINSATTLIAGYDLAASYNWSFRRNYFGLRASGTAFTKYEDSLVRGAPLRELGGKVGNPPKWRGRLDFSWSRDPWAASVALNHTDSEYNDGADPRIIRRDVSGLTTVDVQLSVSPRGDESGWANGLTLRLGANNLFDKRPPFVDGAEYSGFDAKNHPPDGRMVYVRLSKAFGGAGQ